MTSVYKQFSLVILLIIQTVTSDRQAPSDHALTDQEYKRNMGTGYVFFEILRPEDLSYTYKLNPAAFSVPWNMTTSTATLVLADPPCGCGALKNYEDIEGNIALIERGDCSFTSKAIKAQEAGASAVIITDNNDANDELYVSMIDDTTGRPVDIPTAYLLGKNGFVIAQTLRKHQLDRATIRLPINITSIALPNLNQPPWLVW